MSYLLYLYTLSIYLFQFCLHSCSYFRLQKISVLYLFWCLLCYILIKVPSFSLILFDYFFFCLKSKVCMCLKKEKILLEENSLGFLLFDNMFQFISKWYYHFIQNCSLIVFFVDTLNLLFHCHWNLHSFKTVFTSM